MNYVLFGAGEWAKKTLAILGKENVSFIVDNNREKDGTYFFGIPIYYYQNKKKQLTEQNLVISVSPKYQDEIRQQLVLDAIIKVKTITEIEFERTKRKISQRTDYQKIYEKAIGWIQKNTITNEGIINSTATNKPYPEVTGYYIPTLINWGYKDLALQYAKWLCQIQKEDGSWYDTFDESPYIFDSAQILKGLIAIRPFYQEKQEIDQCIIAGCEWILSCMTDEGRLVTPDENAWGNESIHIELIHLYCLSPLLEAGKIYAKAEYQDKVKQVLTYYEGKYLDEICSFSLLSHFYAYVMEALVDLGEMELATKCMENVAKYQKENGEIPAYSNVDWVCSTGMFQLALVWFKLGNLDLGTKAFNYACKLQNESGGWFGSYLSIYNGNENPTYFPQDEISWANKYFLDALYYKNKCLFEKQASIFMDSIDEKDGRYQIVEQTIFGECSKGKKILDIGCGKGRYLRNLIDKFPDNQFYATDLSTTVMSYMEDLPIEMRQGSLTNIPYPDNYFDYVYCCEALEHAIDIKNAIAELARVTKPNGKIIIVDKNADRYGFFEIEEWEQWFDEKKLVKLLSSFCLDVKVEKNISYDDTKANGLFYAWVADVK